ARLAEVSIREVDVLVEGGTPQVDAVQVGARLEPFERLGEGAVSCRCRNADPVVLELTRLAHVVDVAAALIRAVEEEHLTRGDAEMGELVQQDRPGLRLASPRRPAIAGAPHERLNTDAARNLRVVGVALVLD